MGVQALGMGLGTLLGELGVAREVVTGHDYRSYSGAIKQALIGGLMAAGCRVHDIGLALSPMAYFAQFALDVPAVAMVTASHNDNGWTGVKMGADRPVTFGPEEMGRLKDIVLAGRFDAQGRRILPLRRGFSAPLHRRPDDTAERSRASSRSWRPAATARQVPSRRRSSRRSAARSSGSTASSITPFPRYNPNPEDMEMLHAMAEAVLTTGADLGARLRRRRRPLRRRRQRRQRDLRRQDRRDARARPVGAPSRRTLRRRCEIDRACTRRSGADRSRHVATDYWKTGHSYIKRRVRDLERARRDSRSRATSSSTRRSGGAMTMASSPRSPSSTCSTAIPHAAWPISIARCRRPGARRRCRHIAATRSNTTSSSGSSTRMTAEAGRAATHRRLPDRRTSSPSTAYASSPRTAPGGSCAPPRTSPNSSWWSRARSRRRRCGPCSRISTR